MCGYRGRKKVKTSWCFVVRRVTPGVEGVEFEVEVEVEVSEGGSSGNKGVGKSRRACSFQASRTRGSQER